MVGRTKKGRCMSSFLRTHHGKNAIGKASKHCSHKRGR